MAMINIFALHEGGRSSLKVTHTAGPMQQHAQTCKVYESVQHAARLHLQKSINRLSQDRLRSKISVGLTHYSIFFLSIFQVKYFQIPFSN